METTSRQGLRSAQGRWLWIVAAVSVAAVLAGEAAAHVTVAPPFVEAQAATTISFEMPNERNGRATTSLAIDAPPGVELESANAPDGWTVAVEEDRAVWSGGRLTGDAVASFPLVVTARTPAGLETFRATQGYDDGREVSWEATLTVLPPAAKEAPRQHFRRAFVAATVGLAVIGISFLALRRLRPRAP